MNTPTDLQTKNDLVSLDKNTHSDQANWKINFSGWPIVKEIAWEGVYWLARLWFRGLFYGRTLRGRRPQKLASVPRENWPGSAASGMELVNGHFRLRNQSVSAHDWATKNEAIDPALQAEYHRFNWLRDLHSLGTEEARAAAGKYLKDWIANNQNWHSVSWRPDVLADRVCNWLTYIRFFAAESDSDFAQSFLDSTARQVRHLRRAGRFVPNQIERIAVTKALIYASVCLPNNIRYLPRHLKAISKISARQILPDGGHINRNPISQMQALHHMIDIRSFLDNESISVPETLKLAIDRATPMVNFFRHGDGGFALFNGSTESDPQLIDFVLAKAETRDKPPTSAVNTGFERVIANQTVLIADGGAPSLIGHDAHAGALSFEMSVAKQRLIVNCGTFIGKSSTWNLAQKSTAAHSTLVVEDRNSFEINSYKLRSARKTGVTTGRLEADGNTWIEMSHDGYMASYGVTHKRRLYINSPGTNIRGEDTLTGSGDHKFSIRFHLHPLVKASLLQDGGSILLRLPNKSGWRMRCSGGIASLQESIYFGDGQEAKRTEQIVISGASQRGAAQVKWALSKLPDK